MVKCQGLNEDGGPCGFDLQNSRFCPECGTKVPKIDVAKRKDTVACPGTDEGQPCSNIKLAQHQRFCDVCGWKVDQSIFEPGSRVCGANSGETKCTGIIRKNETVCPICKSDKGVPQTAVQKDQVNLAKPENQTQPEHGNGQCELSISEPESAQNPSTTATAHGKPASPFHQAETDQDDAASPPKIPRHTEDGCTEMDTAVDEPSTRSRVENETLQGHTEDGCTEVDTAVDEPSIRSRVENETLQGHGMPQHNTDQKSQTSGANLKLLYGAESQTAVDKNIIQGDNSGSVDTEQSTARSHTQPSGSNVQILYGSDNEEASQGTQNPTKNDCYILPQMSNDNVLQNSGSTSEDQSEKSKDNNHGDTWKPTFSLSTTTKKRSEETPTGKASLSDIAEKSDLSSEDSTPKGDDSTEKFPSSSAAITERGDMPVPKPMSEQKGRSDNSSDPPRQSVECTQGVDSSKITESQQQKGIFNFTGGSTQTTGNNTWQNPDRRFGDKSGSIKDDELFGDSNPSGSEEAEKLESSATGEPSTNPSSLFSLSQNSDKEVNTSSAQTDMDVDVQQQNQDATSLVSKSDGDSESSTDEEDKDDDSSLNHEGSQKKKAKEKTISKTKSRREKKKERKKRKKEEKMKEKGITTDSEPTLPKKDKNQNNRSVRSSGKSTGAIGSSVDMDKSQGEATSMDASSENQWSNKRTRTDTMKVIFHTVFSPSILNDANGGAYLCMISLKVPHIKMKKGRSLDEGFEEYTAEFDLPKKHLDEYINYTYCVNASEGNQDYTPELFYDTTSRHGNVGRYLKVPRAALTSGTSTYTHHQYDGIVYGKLESPFYKKMWNKVFGINDHINNMVVDADRLLKFHFDQLITNLQTSDLTPEEFITMFQNMMRGLTYVYSYRGRIWYNPADFDLFVGKSFKDFALAFIERSQNSNIPEHLRLGIIITLVHIIMWLCPFNEKESKDMGTVCYHLQLQPSDKNTLTKVLDDLKSLFPTSLRMVTNTLQLMNNCLCGQTNNASWLLAAPLLHFLSGKSSPYQQPSTDTGHNKKDPVWWGVEDYKGAPEWFITKSNWNVSVNVMLRKLGPLFNADYLLPRTLMAIIKLNGDLLEAVKSRQFSPDVCIAKLFYCIKATRHMSGTEEKILQDSLEDISLQIMDESSRKKSIDTFSVEDKHQMQIDLYRLFVIGNDLLRVALEYYSVKEVFRVCSCKVTLQALALFEETHEELKEKNTRSVSKKFEHNYMETFDAIRRQVVQCLGNKYSSMHTHHAFKMNLEVWDRVLRIELPSKSLESAFIGFVKDALIKLLEKKMYDIILDVYCEHHNLYGSVVQDILSTLAFKALEKGTVIKTYGHSQYDTKTRYAKLLSSVFEKYWKKMTEEQMFQEAIKWTPFAHFVDMFYQAEHGEHLSEESGVQLTKATTAVEERMNQLKSGTILVKDHSVICANFEQFEKLIMLMMKKDKREMEPTYLRQLVDLRSKELQAFSEVYGLVTDLINMCSRFEVDIEALERKHRSLQNILDVPMSHLCTPGKLDNIMRPEDYRPVVAAFNLSPEELDLLPQMKHCSTSLVFINKWDSTGHRMKRQEGKLSVTKTFELVWEPCIAWWNTIKGKIKQGTMTFQEFDKILGKHDCQIIEREFSLMEENGTWIKERMEQIQLFRDLENCVEGAKIILKVVAAYGLNGDFKPIELITSVMKGTDIAMNALDQSLRQICSVLGGVQEKHITCLREFINCEPLILWIKESMPSGLKELKVFVDLATISAGEGDIEIAKVRCLHSATTGYAPLIFNLNDDIGYKDFLEKCKLVWNELEADPNLHKKLHDTNRQIEWLKTVKKAHGSVEVTSLAQTEAINSVGIYQVGRLQDQKWDQKPELKDVISLHVSEDDNGARQRKVYHYDMLHDLQSRLMLVAGKAEKGKDDVDRFTLILDSVVRLANTYIKLVSSGCVLFSEWKARFLCDRDRKACSFITFGMGDHVSSLKGRKASEEDDVSSIVPRIAKFLEKCYEEWLQYIANKRDQYYELNYLTIDQMVILQKELVKVGTQQEPSQLIFPLLSAMKKDCSMADLISAMRTAQREVENMDELRDEEMAETGSEEEMEEGEEEAIFIREVMKTGYSEELARKALRHYKTDEIDEAVVWCMDHEDDIDEMDVEPDTSEERTEPQVEEFKGWTDTPSSISTVTSDLVKTLENINREVRVDPLVKDLEKLWEKFLTSISCSVSDYLSVEHLGLVLRCLAGKETFTIRRHLIQSFQEGVPNLIICPQNDIFNTVLTIYMNDRQQPLPQPDEVLICSSHTTLDQLDIFWRRAVFNQGNQIYCLANSDLLDYEVSDKGEQCLERHMQKAKDMGIQYKLVVLCSTENEYKSRIVAALERFRRPQLPVANQQMLQNYLADKLKVEKANMKISPASSVDFGRSSVRVVKSWRAGVGKSLYKTRRAADLKDAIGRRTTGAVVSIPLHEKEINVDMIMSRLLECTLPAGQLEPRIFHIDISYEVCIGVDAFLFQLLVLGSLSNSAGYVWIKAPCDHYLVEAMPLLTADSSKQRGGEQICFHRCFDILPDVICRSPEESLYILQGRKPPDYADTDLLFDRQEFESAVFQRPYQYLRRLDERRRLADIDAYKPEGDMINCLQTFLRHCGVRDPSWAELKHFVCFLNSQLQDFEVSAFCGVAAKEDLPGFDKFVLKFLIQMSRDFATRSLVMSEESPIQRMQRLALHEEEADGANDENIIQQFQMRRTWESSPHPYLFFNPDHHSMTFVGFKIERATGNLMDQQTGAVLEQNIMQRELQDSLIRNRVNIDENFDVLARPEKILKLCSVMGMDMPHDPDDTYELTTDNVKKILAIYMRFKCDIPVIIMGETGCGKTRLVKFMCALQCPPGVDLKNMILMKVHGGTKTKDIIKKVKEAEEIARKNADEYGQHIQTVLFFDEANTTEAIGLIKEIMCDRTIGGNQLKLCRSLKIIAACNPYRKHSEELIKRLEQAGLGYHVDAEKTTDKLGRVPLRRLVYRVQPLPQSLLPLVWDFGQLDTRVEELYIRQMVLRYIRAGKLPPVDNLENVVSKILTVSQDFMREQKDECSFVSLRDVERVLEVMSWFYNQSQTGSGLFHLLDEDDMDERSDDEEMSDDEQNEAQDINKVARSLLLALGVCYHACLKKREEYREAVVPHFIPPCQLPGPDPAQRMLEEIEHCQDVFLENVELGKNIAHNQALKENVFMMVTCIELRIPLFLVGKPGSSKSLAKTVVNNAMQGHAAHHELFRCYKEVQMMSYQCSPLSTPDGISGMFRQCAQFQEEKDLTRFVSVVVLDEVGLAEDSPRMPLKTLHPLLEDGCEGDEEPLPYKKVAFIGISNWALDPAKMNRGILVQREVPELEELTLSAKGICQTNRQVYRLIKPLIPQMADAYLHLFNSALRMREFFGLRDFYSLLKMVYAFADQQKRRPTWHQMQHAIMRNFGGMDDINPVEVFERVLTTINITETRKAYDPDCSPAGLIQACLSGDTKDSESRYLLLLTENYGALTILQQEILKKQRAITIFGSSFPSDQEYTQVCRNINRIKVCMETGNTVVLLNLENLYESLYDALNQYYVEFGGERYVDLGLGTHRVKCRVHKDFRLIVVAEKQIVYDKFPIPLINRLEKHFLNVSTMLTEEQLELTEKLKDWAKDFVNCQRTGYAQARIRKDEFTVGDVFMGYHADSCAAIVLHVYEQHYLDGGIVDHTQVFDSAMRMLLWCATPDAVMRLNSTVLTQDEGTLNKIYWEEQQHQCLSAYLYQKIRQENKDNHFAQVTTHSKLITSKDLEELSLTLGIPVGNMVLLNLQSFDTEQQFCRQIKVCFERGEEEMLLIVQSDCGDQNASLVACARYCIQDELQQLDYQVNRHAIFVIQLPRVAGGCFNGFQCGRWHSLHIDDLRPEGDMLGMSQMRGKSVGTLIHHAVEERTQRPTEISMETDNSVEDQDGQQNDMDVDEGDIHLDFNNVDRHSSNSTPSHKLPVENLVLNCILAALSMVKDAKMDAERSTVRVNQLMELLHFGKTDLVTNNLVKGICKHLDVLMTEKEQALLNPGNWLATEAARAEVINTAGTFRRAWTQCLETKVTPILTGIIAFMDTNRNLESLYRAKAGDWIQQLWLGIINCTKATGLQYSELVSPGQTRQELPEVMVRHTGTDGHLFTAQMPFSWIYFRLIEDLVNTTKSSMSDQKDAIDVVNTVKNVLTSRPLGIMLQPLMDSDRQSVLKAYIHDFVHMIYQVSSPQEHQLVCESVYIGSSTIVQHQAADGLAMLIAIHLAYQEAVSRFRNFSSLNRVWPECSEAIIDFQESSPNFFLCSNEEMTLDVMGLHLLLETLEPVKDTLNKERNRAEWLQRVRHYRPVVERLLDMVRPGQDPDTIQCGPRCVKGIQDARMTWNCVLVMKLFLEHVYSIQAADDKFTINRCMPLWTMMKSGADMKSLGALQKVEKFLKMWNKLAVEHYFDIKKDEKCAHCENDMEGPPVYLPCKDKICRRCYNDTVIIKEMICPICQAEIPPNLKANEDIHKSEKSKKYFDYKKRINSFFMEVVSQLCFADDTPPSDEVVEKLLSYITRSTNKGTAVVTKKMTIFDDSIDPTPVLRSFLLQLLLRTSGDQVSIYLQNYLQQAQRFVDQDQLIELCLLILQCLEDVYHQDISKSETSEKKEVRMATDMLKNNLQSIDNEELSVVKLYALAETRFALSVVAKYVQRIYVDKSIKMTRGYRQMIDAAARLCEECGSTWPCIYFIKLLCRRYGLDSYETVCKSGDANMCRWLQMLDLEREEVLECSDLYVVCGDNYIACREMVTRCKLGEDPASLIQQLEALRIMDWKKRVSLLLAVYREMTMSYVYPEDKRKTQPEMYEQLYEALSNHQLFQAQTNLLKAVFQNTIWRHVRCLDLRPGMELKDQSIICLLVHAGITFLQIPDDRSLLQPLITLALLPQNMAMSFLPTMPQDDLKEVQEALLAARNLNPSENPVAYRCPNGHPYIIGNCGRAVVMDKCRECGANIGGANHELDKSNKVDDGTDQTKPGHILGRADQRTDVIVGERKMNPVSCAILRLLTHVSMLLGANENSQVIYNMIQPNIDNDTLADFLLNHIKLDIASLQRLTGRSVDDVLLLMHKVLHSLTETYNNGAVTADVLTLRTKDARNRWEEMFCKHCLSPLLRDMETTLRSCNDQMTHDKRLGSDPLLCLLFEIDTPQEQTSATALQEVPTVWRFRSRISMDHLTTVFQTKMGREHQILRLFLDEDCHLRAIRLIPSILRLQRLLINKYQRKLDRAEATAFTVEQAQDDFIQDGKDDEVKLLIQDFAEAWNCVRQALENFPCPTSNGIAVVSKEFCSKQITDDSPIAMLLPTIKDAGLCSYVLVYFLLKKQKSFLEKYCKVKRQKMTDLPKVKVHDLSPAHLISYHPERDILPIVLANCNYSFEVGKGTKIEYDFGNIERQLGDRFLFAKSDIDIDEIEVMTYRSDVTNAIVFRSLREKIPQVQLGAAVRHQICQELRNLPEICDCLDKLDITISFLKSVGEDPTIHLDTFMTQTLKLTNPLVSPKSKAECQCQHVQCLWLTLAQEKTKCLAKHRKDVFDSLGDDYRKELTDQQEESLQYFCDGLQADKVEVLMEFLFECIMLMIAIPQNTDDEDAYDILNQSLQRNLEGYLYSPLYDDEPLLPDWLADTITRLDADTPDKLLVSQCVSVWLVLFDAYRQKERERR